MAGGLTLDPDGGLTSAGQRALERIFFSLDLDMKDAGRLTLADLKAPLDAKAFGHARVQRFVDACGIDVGGGGEVPLPPEGLTFLQLQEALRKAFTARGGKGPAAHYKHLFSEMGYDDELRPIDVRRPPVVTVHACAGGTQRLTRAIGKAKAMDLCLTGRMMSAEEAERSGLVARLVEADKLMDEAMEAANTISTMSRPAVMINKESVNRAFETTLAEGVRFERRLFHSTFAIEDQKEGMAAFVEKRKADWKHR